MRALSNGNTIFPDLFLILVFKQLRNLQDSHIANLQRGVFPTSEEHFHLLKYKCEYPKKYVNQSQGKGHQSLFTAL